MLPTDLPEWCTAPDNNPTADIVAPSAGIRAEGWNPGDKVPAQFLNWWMNLVGQWVVSLRGMLTRNWFEHSVEVKADVSGDYWKAMALGADGRAVISGHDTAVDPLVYYRLGNAAWAAAGTPPAAGDYLEDVAYDGATLFAGVAPATGKVYTSPSGNTWTDRGVLPSAEIARAIHYADGYFVAVGDQGRIASSVDGTTWLNELNVGGADDFTDVVEGGGVWVAVGENGMLYSAADPTGAWTSQTSQFGANAIRSVTYDPISGLFCAVGDGGNVSTSADGETWVLRDADDDLGTVDLLAVATDAASTLLAQSLSGLIFASYDGGVTWEGLHGPSPAVGDNMTAVEYSAHDASWYALGRLAGDRAVLLQSLRV